MLIVDELLELKDRNLYLEIDGKKIPMSLQFYVADDTFFFNVDMHDDIELHTLDDLRDCLETEAEDPCWSEDIYEAPMNRIGSCEMKFSKDFFKDITDDDLLFTDCYTIEKLETTMDDIIIKLK